MSGTERLLRETLSDPRYAATPGIGLLDRARYDGERLRRRRRRRAVSLSVASMVAIVGVGAALSPRMLQRPLLAHPAAGSAALRIGDPALPATPATGTERSAAESRARPVLWTERKGGRLVTVVATYDGRRLCAQADRAEDAALRPPICSPVRAGASGAALLAGPVGGAGGVRAADASVTRLVLLTSRRVDSVVARPARGDAYLGYLQALAGPAGGRLFEVVLPAGQRATTLRFLDRFGAQVGTWAPGRS